MEAKLKTARDNLRQAKKEHEEAEEVLFAAGAEWVLGIPQLLLENIAGRMEELEAILTSPEMRSVVLEFYNYIKRKGLKDFSEEATNAAVQGVFNKFSFTFDGKDLAETLPSLSELSEPAKYYAAGLVNPIKEYLSTIDSALQDLFEDFMDKDLRLKEAQDELYRVVCELE